MGKKKAGGKKKKKSKEELELERLAAEEAERIQREEDERRRKEEEKLQLERDELERLEKERLRNEELLRLSEEADEGRALAERRTRQMAHFLSQQSKEEDWEAYTSCNPLPSPDSEADLSTYLQSILSDERVDLEVILKQCEEIHTVWKQVLVARANYLAKGNLEEAQACQEKARALFQAQVARLDKSSSQILTHADEYVSAKLEVLLGKESPVLKFGLWVNLASKGFRMKIIDFPGLSTIAEIPKTLALQSIAVRLTHYTFDTVSHETGDDEDFDTALGGVLFLEALKLPPPRKNIKGWSMMPVNQAVHDRVRRLDFNADASSTTEQNGSQAISVSLKFKLARHVLVRSLQGDHFPLPQVDENEATEDHVVSTLAPQDNLKKLSEVRVGAWDAEQNKWTEDGISDVTFDPQSRIASLTTTRMTALAVLQSRWVDLPYRFWSVKPLFRTVAASGLVDSSLMTSSTSTEQGIAGQLNTEEERLIDGALFVLRCEHWLIKMAVRPDGRCTLLEPLEPELDAIRGKPMPPAELLCNLAASGINIISPAMNAQVDTILHGSVKLKNAALEDHVYNEISAAVSSSFAVSSSRWNQQLPKDKCCFSLFETSNVSEAGSFDILEFVQDPEQKDNEDLLKSDLTTTIPETDPEGNNEEKEATEGKEEAKAKESTGVSPSAGEENQDSKTAEAETNNEQSEGDAKAEETKNAKSEEDAKPATEETPSDAKPPSRGEEGTSGSKKKKKPAKKGKKDKVEEEVVEAQDSARNQAHQEEESKEEDKEEVYTPAAPRTTLFECDEEVTDTQIKCSFIRAKEMETSLDTTHSHNAKTHVYLENALLEAGIYNMENIRSMQDDAKAMPLRHSILMVLSMIRPLSLTVATN